MSQSHGGGIGGPGSGGPKSKTDDQMVLSRGGFQGGRGRGGGPATVPAIKLPKVQPQCINAFNPYHECVDYCFERIGANLGATKEDSQNPNPHGPATVASSGIKRKSSNTIENSNNMQRKGLEAAARATTTAAEAAATTTTTATATMENIKPMMPYIVAKDTRESSQDMQGKLQPAPTSPEIPPPTILEDVKPTLSAGAAEPLDQEHEKGIVAVQSMGLIELKGLEEEVKKQREARELRKRRKIETPSCKAEENISEVENGLTLELLEYERLGYLTKVESEDDDESLVRYGDKFGLAVLNEYPKFFLDVPQHPHYRETSLDRVKREMAEGLWDMLMPLIQRGMSAIRENNMTEIAAVERIITCLSMEGFDLRHLQAYINMSRRARANRSCIKGELDRIKSQIETEERDISYIISSRFLSEVIKELEASQAMCKKLIDKMISDFDVCLARAQRLLSKEEEVRHTKTTREHMTLLDLKGELERQLRASNREAWMLQLLD